MMDEQMNLARQHGWPLASGAAIALTLLAYRATDPSFADWSKTAVALDAVFNFFLWWGVFAAGRGFAHSWKRRSTASEQPRMPVTDVDATESSTAQYARQPPPAADEARSSPPLPSTTTSSNSAAGAAKGSFSSHLESVAPVQRSNKRPLWVAPVLVAVLLLLVIPVVLVLLGPSSSQSPEQPQVSANVELCNLDSLRSTIAMWNEESGKVIGAYSDSTVSDRGYLAVHERQLPIMRGLVDQLENALFCSSVYEWWDPFVGIYRDRLTVSTLLANGVRIGSEQAQNDALDMAATINVRADEILCSVDPGIEVALAELAGHELGVLDTNTEPECPHHRRSH